MKLFLAVAFAACFLLACQATPLWPQQWSAGWNFVNTSSRVLLNYGSYYYHANDDQTNTIRELRIDNYNCPHYPGRSIFCQVMFARDGNCYVYAPQANNLCCMLFKGLPASSPNWLENSTYQGVKNYNHIQTNAWLNVPYTDVYYETLKTKEADSVPVALAGGGTGIEWNTVIVGGVHQKEFQFPIATCQKQCSFAPSQNDPFLHAAHAGLAGVPLYK